MHILLPSLRAATLLLLLAHVATAAWLAHWVPLVKFRPICRLDGATATLDGQVDPRFARALRYALALGGIQSRLARDVAEGDDSTALLITLADSVWRMEPLLEAERLAVAGVLAAHASGKGTSVTAGLGAFLRGETVDGHDLRGDYIKPHQTLTDCDVMESVALLHGSRARR